MPEISLLNLVKEATKTAINYKTLSPIRTKRHSFYTKKGFEETKSPYYSIYVSSEPEKISLYKKTTNEKPFLPPFEKGLLVMDSDQFANLCEEGKDYRLFLNKYKVLENHLLLTSKNFRAQGDRLSSSDFRATISLLLSVDSFAFYNAGYNSGRSVDHFHLQVMPYSSISGNFFSTVLSKKSKIREFDFAHYFYTFDTNAENLESTLLACYNDAMESARRQLKKDRFDYNLIFDRQRLLLVPRAKPCAEIQIKQNLPGEKGKTRGSLASLQINALGFCGSVYADTKEIADAID
ncbi:ATP adenylyltransferase, partial [Bonamia ostreae]